MNSNVDGYFITRAETEYLAEKLDQVPDLEREMAIALTSGQARISGSSLGIRRPQPGSREPYSIGLEDTANNLHSELSTTARHVCEIRGMDYDGGFSTAGIAMWLRRYRYAIALMEDAGEMFEKLCHAIDRASKAMNTHEREYVINQAMVEEANRQIVTVAAMEKLAPKLDKLGKGLNARRMRTLCKHAGLEHVSVDRDTGTKFYRLGDVLEAHKRHARRDHA